MIDAAEGRQLKALVVVGANPVSALELDPTKNDPKTFETLSSSCKISSSRNRSHRGCRLFRRLGLRKSRNLHHTYGDLQLVKKSRAKLPVQSPTSKSSSASPAYGLYVRKLVSFGAVHAPIWANPARAIGRG